MAPVLMVTELRTVAADAHWLSSSYGHDVVGLHFTWVRDVERVYAVLPLIEDASCRSGRGRTGASASPPARTQLEPLYPRLDDFRAPAPQGRPGGQVRQRLPRPRHRLTCPPCRSTAACCTSSAQRRPHPQTDPQRDRRGHSVCGSVGIHCCPDNPGRRLIRSLMADAHLSADQSAGGVVEARGGWRGERHRRRPHGIPQWARRCNGRRRSTPRTPPRVRATQRRARPARRPSEVAGVAAQPGQHVDEGADVAAREVGPLEDLGVEGLGGALGELTT